MEIVTYKIIMGMYDNNDIFENLGIKLFNRRTNSSSMGRIYRA
jgi:hypothetical protein